MTLPLVGPLLDNKNSYSYSYTVYLKKTSTVQEKNKELRDSPCITVFWFSKYQFFLAIFHFFLSLKVYRGLWTTLFVACYWCLLIPVRDDFIFILCS